LTGIRVCDGPTCARSPICEMTLNTTTVGLEVAMIIVVIFGYRPLTDGQHDDNSLN